ncbi:MAG: Tim44 domain-containing protein, partial [Caldimonas sp.]
LVLLGLVAIVAIRMLLRRFAPSPEMPAASGTPGGMQFAGVAGPWAGRRDEPALSGASPALSTPAFGAAAPAAAATTAVPAGFDAAAFERIAKLIFIRMQAANDSADLNDLRGFTTPEMYAAVKLDLQDRAGAAQQTDVVRVDAEVLEVATEGDRQVVSVRFHGLIREEPDSAAAPFDEVWHLVRPLDGSREWAIAGIQQIA